MATQETKIVRTTCSNCQVGCGMLAYVRGDRIVSIEGDPDNPLNQGHLCPKGKAALELLYSPQRLVHPLKRTGKRGAGKWQQITWEEAVSEIAEGFASARARFGPESVALIEGAFRGGQQFHHLARFARAFGTPNYGHAGVVCFVPRVYASKITYGYFAIPDYDHLPGLIVIWGKDPVTSLPHVHRRIVRAVENGAKLMMINPVRTWGTDLAASWLKPRPSTDVALALGMMNVIINEGLYDRDFVDNWTSGFDELKTHVQQYTPEMVEAITWVSAEQTRQAARLYAGSKPAILEWGNGVDHGVNSFEAARALCLLRAITGNLEVPGGESRWTPAPLTGNQTKPGAPIFQPLKPSPGPRSVAASQYLPFMAEVPPSDMISAMLSKKPYAIHAGYVADTNALVTFANARAVREALESLDFLAAADIFLTPTAAIADIVLPISTFFEYDDVIAPPYSLQVALVQQKIASVGDAHSDYQTLRAIAQQLRLDGYVKSSEASYLDSLLAPAGVSFEEFKKIGMVGGQVNYRAYKRQGFDTPSGKVELASSQLRDWGFDAVPSYREPPQTMVSAPDLVKEYPLLFTTTKADVFRHSSGRQIPSQRGAHPDPVMRINSATARELGISNGDYVYIETPRGRIMQKAELVEDLDPRLVTIEFGWWFPENGPADLYGWDKSNVNILTDDGGPRSPEMGTTNLKVSLCRVYKANL